MKASVFPGSSGEPLFLNLILCKRQSKIVFSDYGFNWWTWCICEEICKKAECPISGHSAFSIAW